MCELGVQQGVHYHHIQQRRRRQSENTAAAAAPGISREKTPGVAHGYSLPPTLHILTMSAYVDIYI
jgi:hypothetical protein